MTSTPPTRSRAVLLVDKVVGIALALLGMLIGFILFGFLAQLGNLATECDGIAADGLHCAPTYLGAMIIIGYAFVIFGWFVTTGFMIVRFLRKQLGFWLPIVGVFVMFIGFYVTTFALTGYLPAS